MTTVTPNGNTYTFPDDFEEYSVFTTLPNLISDTLVEVGNATTAAAAALASQTAAAGSATAAAGSATTAQKWASEAEDVEVAGGLFSSLHYATKAQGWSTLSQSWAEGTLPGGSGTKSAKEHASDAAASAQTAVDAIASVNLPVISGSDAGKLLRVDAGGTGYEVFPNPFAPFANALELAATVRLQV